MISIYSYKFLNICLIQVDKLVLNPSAYHISTTTTTTNTTTTNTTTTNTTTTTTFNNDNTTATTEFTIEYFMLLDKIFTAEIFFKIRSLFYLQCREF